MQGIGSATQDENPWNRKVQQVSSSTSYDVATGENQSFLSLYQLCFCL